MRLRIQLDEETFDVEVVRTADGFRVEGEGQVQALRLTRAGNPVELAGPSRTHTVAFEGANRVVVDGVASHWRLGSYEPGGPAAAGGAAGRIALRAMMPGRVVKLLQPPGADVEKGMPLLVLEAMKMQNELGSPLAGRLVELKVKEGEPVEAGRVLGYVEAVGRKE